MARQPNRIIIAALCFVQLCSLALFVKSSRSEILDEYKVKMAFIYNFVKFIQWPPEAFPTSDSPIVLCILGDDPFGNNKSLIEDKTVGERKFIVRNIRKMEDARVCHMLFVCRSEQNRLNVLLPTLHKSSILLISDIPDFTRMGGMIGFTTSDDKVRFQVNLTAARAANLEISSKLLKLAEIVIEN